MCRGGVIVRALDSQPKGWWFESHRDYWRLNIRSIVVNYHLMFPVHTSPPSCNGYLAFAGVQIQLNALTYQLVTYRLFYGKMDCLPARVGLFKAYLQSCMKARFIHL